MSSVGPAPSDAPIPLLQPEQAKLAQVWAGMIGIDVNDIRPSDNFFDLGGDSLLAIAAIDEAGRILGFRVEAKR
ncbi:acyl carrier protein, partial [Halomonas sp. ND22Bw]|uniref:acyl carrier protein n=1 Tax=Halomonas sp. ND22Bw TaxID=2054178 RepID=UPI0034E0DB46